MSSSTALNSSTIKSGVGGFFAGSHAVFRGYDLHKDLADIDWIELYVLGITGRRFSKEQVRLLHAIWAYTSYPDPRLWNNRVAALAGNVRSTGGLGLAAALSASEAKIFGLDVCIRAIDFFLVTHKRIKEGVPLLDCIQQELKTQRSLAGYGRPLLDQDERITPILKIAKQLNLDQGKYLKLAFDVAAVLKQGRWRMQINYAALTAALTADIGLNAREYYLFVFPAFLAGMTPCYLDGLAKPVGEFYPSACVNIDYQGPAPRKWHD